MKPFLYLLEIAFLSAVNSLLVLVAASQSPDIVHPHPIDASLHGRLAGHKEKLGNQRAAIGPIDEYTAIPTPGELWHRSVKPYRPAMIRNALKDSVSALRWDDEYLVEEFGDQEVLVEKKYEDRKSSPKRMMLKDFIAQYREQNWYVVSMLPNAMRRDCRVPKPLMCGTFRDNLAELNLWIGTKGTRSMLHYDADNILHCVVSGRKDWILIHPDYLPKLDMVTNRRGQGSGYSHLNVDEIDEDIHSEIWDVPWEYATLNAGDCLYLPPQYLHQVRSYNRSISTTFLFYPTSTFSDEACANVDLDQYLSLSDVYVYWTYEKGQETVDMGYMNPAHVRFEMLALLNATGTSLVDERLFIYLALISHAVPSPGMRAHIHWFYSEFDKDGNGVLSIRELEEADMEVWKQWCRVVEDPHGPTKTTMGESDKASSKAAEFLPRRSDRHLDSRNAYYFLDFVIRVKGESERLSFVEFKRCVKLENGSAADAFILFDIDFSGILTTGELRKNYRIKFREFSRMKYSLANTTLRGGGMFFDEIEDLAYLRDLNEIPEDYIAEGAVKEPEESQMNKLEKSLGRLKVFLESVSDYRASFDMFKEFLDNTSFGGLEIGHFDVDILFRIMDRGQKGYITLKDVKYYSSREPIVLDTYGGFEGMEPFHPFEILLYFLDVMESASDFIKGDIEAVASPDREKMSDEVNPVARGEDGASSKKMKSEL